MYGGRFAGLNREYSGEYSRNIPSARWRLEAARLGAVYGAAALGWTRLVARLDSPCGSAGLGVHGSARREYGARVAQSSSTSGRVGCAWANSAESSGGACGLPPSPMKLILAAVSSS